MEPLDKIYDTDEKMGEEKPLLPIENQDEINQILGLDNEFDFHNRVTKASLEDAKKSLNDFQKELDEKEPSDLGRSL